MRTGTNPKYDSDELYCYQQALAVHATGPDLAIGENLFLENRESGDRPGREDTDPATFRSRVQPLIERLSQRPATRVAAFVQEFAAH